MRSPKTYFRVALIISILFGIVLPLVFGVKAPMLPAILFTFVWLIYAITFLCLGFPHPRQWEIRKKTERRPPHPMWLLLGEKRNKEQRMTRRVNQITNL